MLMGVRVYFLFNMKLIDSKVEYLPQENGIEGIYKMIEVAGRTAYQSLDKITDDSAKGFVDRMINSKHFAALEHGTVYLLIPQGVDYDIFDRYKKNKYSVTLEIVLLDKPKGLYVTTNLRVLQENGWLDDLQYLCEPTEYHERRYTFRFTTDIGICRELLRHRKFSFLNESTRYCNYSKGKFGGEITFIKPSWYQDNPDEAWEDMKHANFKEICEQTEAAYINSVDNGATPQEARQILPLATKTELIMTGFSSDWRYLLDLRLYGKTGKPHPDMLNLMEKLRYKALEAGIWYDIMKYPSEFK